MKLTGKIVALGFFVLVLAEFSHGADALRKMTVGQAGVNPGAGLFSIAVNQGFYKKHGLDVEIIKTNTTAAVQAMLANKMQMATGAGMAAFVTAHLEGAPALPWSAPGSMSFPTRSWRRRASGKSKTSKAKPAMSARPSARSPTPPCVLPWAG